MDQNSHFLNALKMMMHGSWSTSSGASWNGKAFSFPVSKGSLSSTAQKADVKYSGSVHFTGVGGRMDLTLADPEIVVNNGDDHVIMSVKSKTMVGQSVDYGRITFVDMTGSITQGQNDAAQVVGTNVKLNSQAVDAFAGFYQAGKPMDDIDSSLKLGPQSSRPEPTVAPKPSVKPKPRVSPKPSAKPKSTVAPKPDQSTIMAPQSDAATEAAAGEAPSAGAHKIIRKQVCTVVPGASRATSPTSTPAKVGKGSMNWGGGSTSFVNALKGPMQGKWTMSGGASADGTRFNFPFSGGNYDRATKTGNLNFSGGVHFTGVHGLLDLSLSDPSLSLKNGKGVMKLTLNAGGMAPFKGRVDFANVSVVPSGSGFTATSVVLTGNGVQVWNGFYKKGHSMDNFSVSLGDKSDSASAAKQNSASLVKKSAASPTKRECHDVLVDAKTGQIISGSSGSLPNTGV
ncbi:HtaA domain-containing protein [Cutibacterium acnes]